MAQTFFISFSFFALLLLSSIFVVLSICCLWLTILVWLLQLLFFLTPTFTSTYTHKSLYSSWGRQIHCIINIFTQLSIFYLTLIISFTIMPHISSHLQRMHPVLNNFKEVRFLIITIWSSIPNTSHSHHSQASKISVCVYEISLTFYKNQSFQFIKSVNSVKIIKKKMQTYKK